MPERQGQLVPMEYAQTTTTRFVVDLPEFVDKARIGVNINEINRLCRIGGIRHVRVATESHGERSDFVPAIVGFDSKGQAVAGKTGISKAVPSFTFQSEQNRDLGESPWGPPHAATWINTTITVNNDEVIRRVTDNPKWEQGVRSSEAWAHHLNRAVKEGITKSGFKHLTMGLNKYNWGDTAIQYAIMSFFEAQNPSVQSAILRLIFVSAVLNIMAFTRSRGSGEDFRWSLMYGPQLDRALILKLVSKRATLIKDLPKDVPPTLPTF